MLRSVVGRDANDVDGVVSELVRTRVFERRGTDGWRFRHELFREVAAELARRRCAVTCTRARPTHWSVRRPVSNRIGGW
ncbi:kinase domain protein [Mycobacterium xenopi 4042]|uniref:Kinase domain protein n=1 Tax=Mycobacterium xenopi 4042 TaxID=1299334 RepID=X8DLK1_MYCXE|nr:kinase domain protein [Mycobacterium xenopi 4042]